MLPQLSYESVGWISQIFLAIFLIAGGIGGYVGFKNGKREGISKRTQQTIDELESLTQTLAATTDALERQVKYQKEVIVNKDRQIEDLQKTIDDMLLKHITEMNTMKAEWETERRYLLHVIKQFESKVGQLSSYDADIQWANKKD